MAAAVFVSAALTTTDASALALGSLTVRSALGENLNAEIALPQATAAEISSLVAQIASAETFRAQGMDYSGSARAIQVQLQRNADGTASLRLTSSTPIQDPFVDLVLETQWSTGRLVRSYTLLLDPPASQRSTPAPTAAPQVAPAPAAATGRNYSSSGAQARRAAPRPAKENTAASDDASTARVRAGDTAGRIASANKPAGVSLDQMLVAMLRSNPDAFINGNMNRIRAGAVVQLPNREQALETSASEARKIVAAQSRDFNAYRRSLAAKAPQATVQAADRSSSGQVQAKVAESRPAAETPDKLTLSKGAIQSAAAEAKVAEQKQASDQDNRLNELQRNLAELNDLAKNTNPQAPATPAAGATAGAAPSAPAAADSAPTTPAVEVPNATAAATAAAEPAPAPENKAPAATESAAAPTPAAAQPAAPVAPVAAQAEPSMVDELLDNPLVPAGAGLVALLLGLLGYTAWKRRRAAQAAATPAMADSQLHPDSFFGGSGGQQVDTSSAEGAASTMAYSPSQLDGGGDVDAVAEADVYLAYGRDVQAEEILKEALRNQPERLAIHVKLAEIYVKRHDIKALEALARGMQQVSSNTDAEWQRVVEMGRQLDPANPFFAGADAAGSPASTPTSAFAAALSSIKQDAPAAGAAAASGAAAAMAKPSFPDIDLNLDLPDDASAARPAPAVAPLPAVPAPSDDDFAALELPGALDSKLDVSAPAQPASPPTLVQDTQIAPGSDDTGLSDLDLDLAGFSVPGAEPLPPAEKNPAPQTTPDLDTVLSFDLEPPAAAAPAPVAPAPVAPAPAPAGKGVEFDLGSLDLDLGDTSAPAAAPEPVHNLVDDPLSTKLDLAQEFNAIGDSEGARALIEEVLAEASGPLKARAQKMLSELD